MSHNKTENMQDKGEVHTVAGGKKEKNPAAKKSLLYNRQWGLPHTSLFGPRIRKNIFTLIRISKTPSEVPPVAVLIHSTEYICPRLLFVASPWKIPAVIVFIPDARALLSSLLLLTLWELTAQKAAPHVIINNSLAPPWLLHTCLLCETYLELHQKTKRREYWKSIDCLILGSSSLPWHIAVLEIYYSLNVYLNLDLNSNWVKI